MSTSTSATGRATMEFLLESAKKLADKWAGQRRERMRRRELDRQDFDDLAAIGYTLVGVPVEHGGLWVSIEESVRPLCEVLRTLAKGDPSVALVASMHPAVLASRGWLDIADVDAEIQQAWTKEREWAFQTALNGHFWGTIVSEPGSGGDQSKTISEAKPGPDGTYLLSGRKHFGSGSGMVSFLITTGLVDGEVVAFHMDMREVPLDGSKGVELIAPWDGHGMIATQSHGMTFTDFPAYQSAWPGGREQILEQSAGSVACMFTSVIVGVVETAVETATEQLARKRDALSSYQQVEWSNVEIESWLMRQAYEGMLNSMKSADRGRQALLGKTAVAQLSESVLTRISKVIGGSAFSRHLPYGFWAQDVRALGFLRPPWSLAYDQIFASCLQE